MTARILGAAMLSVLLLPAAAGAQAISGVVTDASGGVVPGVTVEARSPALIEQVRTVVTDGAGLYSIIQLVPGTYTVTFTLPGFSTVVREGVVLTTGFTATVEAQLRAGAVTETITVTGASPIIDVQNVAQQRVATREIVDSVPVAKTFQSLGVLIPGITTGGVTGGVPQDVGGQSGNNNMNMAIHGGKQGDQHINVDGMSVEVFTREDGTAMWIADANYQEYVFDYSANTAEVETGGVRINLIPREGGNRFNGAVNFNLATEGMASNNLDDALRARGLRDANRLQDVWNFSAVLGGPIMRDRLWFLLTHTRNVADTYEAGVYFNQDVRARTYTPVTDRQGVREDHTFQQSLRLTWQATARNKVTGYWVNGEQCRCFWLIRSTTMPEATSLARFGDQIYQLTWSSPVTNRLLMEAAGGSSPQVYDWNQQPFAATDLPGILEQAGNYSYRNKTSEQRHHYVQSLWTARGSVSYVTGSHSAKVGFTLTAGTQTNRYDDTEGPRMSYTTFNGVPQAVTYRAYPLTVSETMRPNLGVYLQDQWRTRRLSVSGGVRFDYFRNSYPDQFQPASTWVRNSRSIEGQTVVSWKDLSPRVGVAYDLFGNGKTAVKASASRYVLREGTGYAFDVNPARNNASVQRSWTDRNNNFYPDGDPFNPALNDELGPSLNVNFGLPIITRFYDPEWAFGFGHRPANWEFSTAVQHEVRPGLGVSVAYFRRVYTNFSVQDNRAVGPSDYSPYCVTAPVDPRLPDGGGYQLCGLFDLNLNRVGITDRITTSTEQFGTQQEHWNGFDFTANGRIRNVLLQGGISTGKTMTDNCDLAVDSPSVLYCHSETPFLTQLKLLGSYLLPYDIQVSATLQSVPGPPILANVIYTTDQVQPSLGRPLASARTVTINVVAPGTLYGERWNQLDLRVSKTVPLGNQRRLKAMLDLYNALNDNTILGYQNSFVPNWQQPTAIMPARLVKIAFQFDF